MEAVVFTVVISVFVISLVCLVKVVSKNFLKSKNNVYKVISVIPLKGSCDDVEYTVRSVMWGDNWNEYCVHKIILAMQDCDDETVLLCNKLAQEYDCVTACELSKLSDVIKTI